MTTTVETIMVSPTVSSIQKSKVTSSIIRPKTKPTMAIIETTPLGEAEPKVNNIEDLTEEEIQEAIDQVLKTSIYSGSSRTLMVQAINDTVHGRMSLTQAAAKFGIPFSTIHPYIKKLRTKLQLRDPALEAKKPRIAAKRKPKVNGGEDSGNDESKVSGDKKPRKKRSPPPGYIPFKQIVIPEHWKKFPEKMQNAVWTAVSYCNYDDIEKKHRLCQAILDVMIGQKTLKAAASNNNIPFTTLQTYFHRSRITMERCMEEDEEVQRAKPKDDSITPPLHTTLHSQKREPKPIDNFEELEQSLAALATLPIEQQNQFVQMLLCSDTNIKDSSTNNDAIRTATSTPSTEKSMGKSVDAVSDWLIIKKLNEQAMNTSLLMSNGNGSFEAAGSRKRKPQHVKRVTPDGLNLSATSTSSLSNNTTSKFSDFLEERFGLTVMKPSKTEENGFNNHSIKEYTTISHTKFDINASEIHSQCIIFNPDKFANTFIPYYVFRVNDIRPKNYEKIISALKMVIIDKKPLHEIDLSNIREIFDKHLTSVQNLMKYIAEAYPVFLYQIKPETSNFGTVQDYIDGKPFYHNRLLNQPPNSLLEMMTINYFQLIVKYLERFVAADMQIDMDLTKFLINQVIKNRSLPELYKESEYKFLHERILSDEILRRYHNLN
uniref:HTH psq-type domain-containing protein n=1 Tax=Panagrolaimus sp. PS1159 TaxID=55785 RepID=A0AC35GRF1_9BILA